MNFESESERIHIAQLAYMAKKNDILTFSEIMDNGERCSIGLISIRKR